MSKQLLRTFIAWIAMATFAPQSLYAVNHPTDYEWGNITVEVGQTVRAYVPNTGIWEGMSSIWGFNTQWKKNSDAISLDNGGSVSTRNYVVIKGEYKTNTPVRLSCDIMYPSYTVSGTYEVYHGHYNVTVTAVEPTGITISPSSKTINVGDTFNASYTLTPSNATTTVTWSSDKTSIATVSQSGLVTGISAGETKIRVKTANGKTDDCTIYVTAPPPTGISTRESLTMAKIDTYKMSYSLTPYYAKATIAWSSENKAVATVDASSGKVTAKGVGSTNIVATTDNGKSCKCQITVIAETALMRADIKQVAADLFHSMILKTDGSLWACGDNNYGQLGDGTTKYKYTPVKVMDNVASVAAGDAHSMILKTDGSLWACGSNSHGQLGDGTTTKKLSPVKVMDGVASVAAGDAHSMILKTDGSLWACGDNFGGQLGNGTTNSKYTPVKVMDNVASVAAGDTHSMILKTDGSLWACGYNFSGQLGDGTTTKKLSPVKVMDGVASVAAGDDHSMILKTDGSLWACGFNSGGQLGDGTTTDSTTPVKVMDGVASVAAGGEHSMILKTDGSLWACGSNSHGQLGDGTTTDSTTPVKVMDGVASVAAGVFHSMILKTDGSLWACGDNNYGQLGDGTNIHRYTPIKIVEAEAKNDGTLLKPFTPSEAKEFVSRMDADVKSEQEYYIKGKIIEITDNNQFGTQYGNCTFYISDDGTDKNDKFYVYRTLYLGNVKYSDDSWLKPKAGDEVIICGKLVNYKGNTSETVTNQSYIYSLNGRTQIHDYYYYVGAQNGWECNPTEKVLWEGSYNVDWGTPYEGLKTELINHVKSGSILRAYVSQTADDYCVGGASTGGWANILTGKVDPDREDFLISGDMVLEYPLNDLSIQLLQEQDGFLMVGHGYTLTKITVVNPIPFKKLSDGITWELTMPCEEADIFRIGTFASLIDGWDADVYGSSEDNPSALNGIMSKINGPNFQVPFEEGMYSYTVRIVPSTMSYEIIVNKSNEYPQGDVNMDNAVNGTDLVALSNIVLGRKEKTETADVNKDGSVNGTDIVALSNIILGRSNKAPHRAPETGASLSIEPFDIKAGETKEMLIDLTNPNDEVTLVQFDLHLPAGLSIKKSGSDLDFDMAGRTSWRKHTLDANEVDGAYRFLLYSSGNTLIEGTSGAVIKVNIVADESFNGGKIVLDNILLVDPNEKETKPKAYEYVIPTPDDGSAKLSIEPFDIAVGETKEMLIDLLNPNDEVTLVQFDLHLPAGLSIKKNGSDLDFDMAGRTSWRKHTLDANEVDVAYRFLLYSSGNTLIEGTSGAIIKVNLVADESFNGGKIVLDNILLVDPNEKETKPANYEYVIGSGSGISTVMMDAIGKNARIYNLSGQKLAAPQKGINIIGGKKVVVK